MGCERVLDVSAVLDASVAELLAGKTRRRGGSVGKLWRLVVAGRVWFKSEDRLKKNGYLRSQPLNHMKPARQEVGANYNKDLPK